ncbi:hypothetical protein [Frisingicoccus sp.]|uniref:hypothetical protein n=1 Tax=Frisingicoccus sp. TaxID=1918627 RepID=UPI00386F633F
MGYLDKMHKRAKINKLIKEVMNSYEYKEAMKKENEQQALRAYCNFILMACDYLELKHNYGQKGLNNFLKFANERLHYIADDNDRYFDEMNQYFVDKFKVNVLETFNLAIEDGGEDNG